MLSTRGSLKLLYCTSEDEGGDWQGQGLGNGWTKKNKAVCVSAAGTPSLTFGDRLSTRMLDRVPSNAFASDTMLCVWLLPALTDEQRIQSQHHRLACCARRRSEYV
jgi:hypothetical protein